MIYNILEFHATQNKVIKTIVFGEIAESFTIIIFCKNIYLAYTILNIYLNYNLN